MKTKFWLLVCLACLALTLTYSYPVRADEGQEAKPDAVNLLGTPAYEVRIVTSYADGAGTDADVLLTIFGDKGTTSEQKLDQPNVNDHEEGELSTHRLFVSDVGNINRIRLRHNNGGSRPGWLVDTVVTKRNATGQLWFFPVFRWLADDACDRLRDVTLFPNFRPPCPFF